MANRLDKRRGCFGSTRPLSIAALDAAISATIEKPVRRDRLARDDRVYRWICRRAIAEGGFTFNTTYAEAAAGSGYEVPRLNTRANRREARHMRVSTVYRALSSLAAAHLITFEGKKRPNGQWRCLTITLLPAGRGAPPAGRSRRRPTRRPGGRVLFSRQSGTSPAVVLPNQLLSKRQPARGRARGPDLLGGRDGPGRAADLAEQTIAGKLSRETIRALIRASIEQAGGARSYTPWPNERFDLDHQELVEVAEAFEATFGRPARFSFERNDRHGAELARIMRRIDRYSGAGWKRGAGVAVLCSFFRGVAEQKPYNPFPDVQSLAYFLPIFDEISKEIRRHWKRAWAPKWGYRTGPIYGSSKLGFDPRKVRGWKARGDRGRGQFV